MKRRDRRRRNAIAKDLHTPKYRQRIEKRKLTEEERIDDDIENGRFMCHSCGVMRYACVCFERPRLVRQGLLPPTGLRSDLEGDSNNDHDKDRDSKEVNPDESTKAQ